MQGSQLSDRSKRKSPLEDLRDQPRLPKILINEALFNLNAHPDIIKQSKLRHSEMSQVKQPREGVGT